MYEYYMDEEWTHDEFNSFYVWLNGVSSLDMNPHYTRVCVLIYAVAAGGLAWENMPTTEMPPNRKLIIDVFQASMSFFSLYDYEIPGKNTFI